MSAKGEAGFASGKTTIRTIDVMPADVQVWSREGAKTSDEDVGRAFDTHVRQSLPALLAGRGYRVSANLDWAGTYDNGNGVAQALTPQQMIDTAWALSSYGVASDRAKRQGLIPHLPHRLGEATKSDATLYVGGWAYAGEKRESQSTKVLKVVAIVAVVAIVVVVVAALADDVDLGSVGSGVARAGGQAAKATARVAGGIGRAAIQIGSSTTRILARAASSIDALEINLNIHTHDTDSFGRVDTHSAWYRGRPDYYAQKSTPSDGPSEAMLEMILVDNRRGVVLWHARQRFPAELRKPADVDKMMSAMLAALPASDLAASRAPSALAAK